MPDNRPEWTDYFLGIAAAVAARSDCRRAKVGAVITDQRNRIVSAGYVGTTPGRPGCLAGACPRAHLTADECPPGSDYGNCISQHAEINALLYSSRRSHDGGTLYVTRQPCDWCAKVIRAAGLSFLVYGKPGAYTWVDLTTEHFMTVARA